MIRWLDTVRFDNLSGAMVIAAIRVAAVYRDFPTLTGTYECWITSGSDGVHNSGSVHAEGNALDFRTKDLPDNVAEAIFRRVRDALGPAYFVKLEKVGDTPETSAPHLHVQYNERKNNILEP